jgi:Amt family ammonium transporter
MDLTLTLWLLIGGAMILFMHGGFCMLEAGFIRTKTTGTVIMNNLTDFSICGIIFWAFGMGFAFNGTSGWFGGWDFCSTADYSAISVSRFQA